MAGAGAALLHVIFLGVAMSAHGTLPRHPKLPDEVGSSATAGRPDGWSPERHITMSLLSELHRTEPNPVDAYLEEQVEQALAIEVTGPDAVPMAPLAARKDGSDSVDIEAELLARTKLMGVYESQIRARIMRAWRPPESANVVATFHCRAEIRRGSDGRVREVELTYDGCDGSPEDRQSVVAAIFRASPLPAPPHPEVFIETFSLALNLMRTPVKQ